MRVREAKARDVAGLSDEAVCVAIAEALGYVVLPGGGIVVSGNAVTYTTPDMFWCDSSHRGCVMELPNWCEDIGAAWTLLERARRDPAVFASFCAIIDERVGCQAWEVLEKLEAGDIARAYLAAVRENHGTSS